MCVFQENKNNNMFLKKLHFLLKRKLKFEGKKRENKTIISYCWIV
jgi:hypothetical protein